MLKPHLGNQPDTYCPDRPMTRNPDTLLADTEALYDLLAQAIDQAGADKTELFLTKLALLQAHAIGHLPSVQQHIEAALRDL